MRSVIILDLLDKNQRLSLRNLMGICSHFDGLSNSRSCCSVMIIERFSFANLPSA